jgi:cell division protein FtsQ
MKRVLIVVSTVALLCALLWFLLLSPVFLLNASSIKVSGTNTWVSASRIEDIAKQQLGTSLFIVPRGDMEEQIGELPGVTSATVHKIFRWRQHRCECPTSCGCPQRCQRCSDGGGQGGAGAQRRGASVDGIPIIEVSSVGKGTDDAAVKQALKVLAVLPESMRKQITKVSASTQDSITTEISNGQYVIVWGDSSQIALKKAWSINHQ